MSASHFRAALALWRDRPLVDVVSVSWLADQAERKGQAELSYWLTAAGVAMPSPGSDMPYAMLASGRWQQAAKIWRNAGCTYEYAAALSESDRPDDPGEALTTVDKLAARVRALLTTYTSR